jgi:hypothetical protein
MQVKDVTKLCQFFQDLSSWVFAVRYLLFCVNLFHTKPLFFHLTIHKRLDDTEYGENKFEFLKNW